MLQWTGKFETGDALVDDQHKTLIGYINELEGLSHTTNPTRQDVEFILNLVAFVEDYTVAHFKYEENCMLRHRCAACGRNQAAHAHFLQFFQTFKQRFTSEGCRPEILKDLHTTCSRWIADHILGIDLELKACLAADGPAATAT